MFKSDVFDRSGADEVSRRTFYGIIGAVLTWGFFATAMVAQRTATWHPGLGMTLLCGLVLPFAGIMMSASRSAVLSFVGFHFVALPFGAILGPALAAYKLADPTVVAHSAMLTATITGVMAATGVLFPSFYSRIGGALFAALLSLVVVRIIGLFVPAFAAFSVINYLAAGLFSLYIGYDMYRASTVAATLDNAVDISVALYLDILNLFLTILQIESSGSRK